MSAQTASRGNGSGRPARSTIWNDSVRRSPSTRGAPGSTRLIKNTSAAARAAAGRISGQLSRRHAARAEPPASRAASSHDGLSRSTAGDVIAVTAATAPGSVVQAHAAQSGKPDHDSRLKPFANAAGAANGQDHCCGCPHRPSSPSAMYAGETASIETINPRPTARPQNRRRAPSQAIITPTTSEATVTIPAKTTLLRAQVHAKSS